MPNQIPVLTAAGSLPEPLANVTGRPVLSDQWQRVAGTLHHDWGRAAGVTWGQSWPSVGGAGGARREVVHSAPAVDLLHPITLPWHSSHRPTLDVWLHAQSALPSTIRLNAGGADVDVAVGSPDAWHTATVPAVPAASGLITLTVQALAPATTTVVLYSLSGWVTQLAVGGVVPVTPTTGGGVVGVGGVGHTTLGPDYPLSSARLRGIRALEAACYAAPRTAIVWTSPAVQVDPYTSTPGVPGRAQPGQPIDAFARVLGDERDWSVVATSDGAVGDVVVLSTETGALLQLAPGPSVGTLTGAAPLQDGPVAEGTAHLRCTPTRVPVGGATAEATTAELRALTVYRR